jgi:hypothetical protein
MPTRAHRGERIALLNLAHHPNPNNPWGLKPVSMEIRKARFWSEILAAMACALALFTTTVGIVAGVTAGEPESGQARSSSAIQPQAYEGMVTDTQCGAKHSAAIGMTASDCTRVCVHGGEQFALVDGDTIYALEGGLAALKRVAGQRVRIVGTLNGNKIAVVSVDAAR